MAVEIEMQRFVRLWPLSVTSPQIDKFYWQKRPTVHNFQNAYNHVFKGTPCNKQMLNIL